MQTGTEAEERATHCRWPAKSYTLTSPVKTCRLLSPRSAACESMCSFCVAELDSEVMFEFGYFYRAAIRVRLGRQSPPSLLP